MYLFILFLSRFYLEKCDSGYLSQKNSNDWSEVKWNTFTINDHINWRFTFRTTIIWVSKCQNWTYLVVRKNTILIKYIRTYIHQLSHHHNYYQLSTGVIAMPLKVQACVYMRCVHVYVNKHILYVCTKWFMCACACMWADHMFKMFVCFTMSTLCSMW